MFFSMEIIHTILSQCQNTKENFFYITLYRIWFQQSRNWVPWLCTVIMLWMIRRTHKLNLIIQIYQTDVEIWFISDLLKMHFSSSINKTRAQYSFQMEYIFWNYWRKLEVGIQLFYWLKTRLMWQLEWKKNYCLFLWEMSKIAEHV